jgi:hypothetical protein
LGNGSTAQSGHASVVADTPEQRMWYEASQLDDLTFFDIPASCGLHASFSPAPTFTALTAFPGTVVRRLYRQAGAFATS